MRISIAKLASRLRLLLLSKHAPAFVALLLCLVSLSYYFHLKEQELQQQLQAVQKVDQAEADFSNGLMHLALAGELDSPWQYKVGITLTRQALNEYQNLAQDFPNIRNNAEFIQAINGLSFALEQVEGEASIRSAEFRQRIFVMRKQVGILERQLSSQLAEQRLVQSRWLEITLISGVIVLLVFTIALMRSERSRKGLDSDLKLSEQRFFKLLQNTDEVFWLESYDEKRLIYVSPAFERYTTVNLQHVLSMKDAWKQMVHEDDQLALTHARRNAIFETQDIEFRLLPEQVVASHSQPGKMKEKVRWIAGRIFPIWADDQADEGQSPEYIGAVLRDVTQKREYQRSLVQTQKMDSLGQLTGGVAHDFNNLLTVIMSNAQLLLPHLKDKPAQEKTLSLITRAAQRGASLNQQLLTFASKQQLHPEVVSVNALVADSVDLLRRTIGENYRIVLEQSSLDVCVKVDPGQMQNMLMNLCLNARDAMPNGGRISIRISLKKGALPALGDAKGGEQDCVKIIVKDSGFGISSKHIDRVFDPFFTTKADAKGTGMGLSMVYGFVRQSGGSIRVDSKVNKGTTFHIELPKVAEQVIEAKPAELVKVSKRVCILLVEDDDMVRESTAAALHESGMQVVQANCAAQAKLVLANKSDIDVLVTDVVMPGEEDGFALAQYVQTHFPDIRVLAISGYIGQDRQHLPEVEFLQKPFTTNALLLRINSLIQQA